MRKILRNSGHRTIDADAFSGYSIGEDGNRIKEPAMCKTKCEFGGCEQEARWVARKLWGKGGQLVTCDEHKPDAEKRAPSLRHLPFFYEVKPLECTCNAG
jgi:hypothetical protein